MRRLVTNITLPVLLASVLLLAESGGPGATEAAPVETATAAAPASPDAPATAEAQDAPVSVPAQGSSIPAGASPANGTSPANGAIPEKGASPANAGAPVDVPMPAGPPVDGSKVVPPVPDEGVIAPGTAAAAPPEREEGEEAATTPSELASDRETGMSEPLLDQTPAPYPPAGDEHVGVAAERPSMPAALGIAIDPLAGPTGQSPDVPLSEAVAQAEERKAKPLHILHGEVPPGTYQRLSWSATELFEGVPIATPVLIVNGRLPGPTLCLTAAVHGDELNGIEMVRRVMHDLDAKELSGAVVGVPIVNLQGFRSASRYLPDRRDLNRYFPGNPQGSQASRIAFSFFTEIVTHCDALVDLHTGSFERANLPQLRADLRNPDVVTLTQGFGATVILHSEPAEGTLRWAATRAGIPAVTLEAGGPTELELKEVMHGVKGIETLLHTLGMVQDARLWGDPEPVYYQSTWVRANSGGILLSDVSLGSTVERGDLLGTITDPMSNDRTKLYSPYSGRIIGMARNQVVMPGFAAFHVGIQTVETTAAEHAARKPLEDAALKHETEETQQDYIDGMSE